MALEALHNIKKYITANLDEIVSRKVLKKIIADVKRLVEFPVSVTNLVKNINVSTERRKGCNGLNSAAN